METVNALLQNLLQNHSIYGRHSYENLHPFGAHEYIGFKLLIGFEYELCDFEMWRRLTVHSKFPMYGKQHYWSIKNVEMCNCSD